MSAEVRVQDGIATVFNNASGYYRTLRWEKNRLTLFEKELTGSVLEEELGQAQVGSALELGCGPGTWTPLLARLAEHVVAVDLSEGMLAQARESISDANVEFVHGDISQFESSGGFDLIISVRVLEYVPEWDRVIAGLRRLLNPGGRAVVITKTPVSVWRGTGRERWFGPRTLGRTLTGRRLDPDFWQQHIPIAAMRRAFDGAGLADVKVRPVIVGLPIYMRGTKQYPILPPIAEVPALRASRAVWRWASDRGALARAVTLPISESYAVSGHRPR